MYAITNGTIEKGTILIEKGKIKTIGENLDVPKTATLIDAKGKTVTP